MTDAIAPKAAETPLRSGLDGPRLDVAAATPDDLFSLAPAADELYIPELDRKVLIRYLSGQERDAYEASIVVGKGQNMTVNMRGARAKLAALCLANPDGSRMFEDGDVKRLAGLPAIVLEQIFDRARKINGLTGEDTDEARGNS